MREFWQCANLSKGKTLTYGIENKADVMATEIEMERFGETKFTLHIPNGNAEVSMQLVRYDIM